MLLGDFIYVTDIVHSAGKIDAVLELNAGHEIFAGHFPGQPIVPGVCMMQLIKELLEAALAKTTRMNCAENMKFLTIIDPTKTNVINATLKYSIDDEGRIKITASLLNGPITYFKMAGTFILAEGL